jgi:hypothetical protein
MALAIYGPIIHWQAIAKTYSKCPYPKCIFLIELAENHKKQTASPFKSFIFSKFAAI